MISFKALEVEGCYVIPIETGPTQRGVPDLFISKHKDVRDGRYLWCELKIVSPEQIKEPRSAKQVIRQNEMRRARIRVLNAFDVRDSKDNNCGYRIMHYSMDQQDEFIYLWDLVNYILINLES